MSDTATRGDRIAGAMLGAAIGDAMGAAFEFVTSDKIERICGEPVVRTLRSAEPGSLLFPRVSGRVTDDTALALSVAWTLSEHANPTSDDFARGFLKDVSRPDGRVSTMFWEGGPGGATTRALSRLGRGAVAATCGTLHDGGNGAAMRAHPVGILMERKDVLRVAALQARVTHGHPAAIAAAQAVAVLVYEALHGEPITTDLPGGIEDETFAITWRLLHKDLSLVDGHLPTRLRNVAMSGWETVAAAHAIVCCYPGDAASAIGAAVGSGGDTDTVGTIVGAISGARHGLSALPKHLLVGLVDQTLVNDAIGMLIQRGDRTRIASSSGIVAARPAYMTELESPRMKLAKEIAKRSHDADAFTGYPLRRTVTIHELRQLRQRMFKLLKCEWSELFNDTVAQAIVEAQPTSELALNCVPGISARKTRLFGDIVVALFVFKNDPDATAPERPSFDVCNSCAKLHVLATRSLNGRFVCGACSNRKRDVRFIRDPLVKLETGRDWDLY